METIKVKPNSKGEYIIKLYGMEYKIEFEKNEENNKKPIKSR